MNIDTAPKNIHEGRNVKRFREILGIKQEALAIELDVTQAAVSKLESKEKLEDEVLEKIAKVLQVPTEAIKNFDEEQAVNIIANTFHDSAVANTFTEGAQANFNCTFNPLDKVMELFERLLESEKEKTQLMKDILDRMG